MMSGSPKENPGRLIGMMRASLGKVDDRSMSEETNLTLYLMILCPGLCLQELNCDKKSLAFG